MDLIAEERQAESPYVERIWHSHSEQTSPFVSIANPQWSIVVSRFQGTTTLTVRGPETRATPAHTVEGAEYFGIMFRPGTIMPPFPPASVIDRQDVNLPEASSKSFWLNGASWQFPDFENADTFIDRLVRDGLLIHDPVVAAVLQRQPVSMSLRTVQRRFLQATGITHGTLSQIQRARYATTLLKQGIPILDVVDQAGYSDQPHLTRSLKHFIGHTPAQLIAEDREQPLSFLFKTEPF